MAIIWARNVLIDGEPHTIEVLLGERYIGDKMYYRIGKQEPVWFEIKDVPPMKITRDVILEKALSRIKEVLKDRKVTYIDGREFDWRDY